MIKFYCTAQRAANLYCKDENKNYLYGICYCRISVYAVSFWFHVVKIWLIQAAGFENNPHRLVELKPWVDISDYLWQHYGLFNIEAIPVRSVSDPCDWVAAQKKHSKIKAEGCGETFNFLCIESCPIFLCFHKGTRPECVFSLHLMSKRCKRFSRPQSGTSGVWNMELCNKTNPSSFGEGLELHYWVNLHQHFCICSDSFNQRLCFQLHVVKTKLTKRTCLLYMRK